MTKLTESRAPEAAQHSTDPKAPMAMAMATATSWGLQLRLWLRFYLPATRGNKIASIEIKNEKNVLKMYSGTAVEKVGGERSEKGRMQQLI